MACRGVDQDHIRGTRIHFARGLSYPRGLSRYGGLMIRRDLQAAEFINQVSQTNLPWSSGRRERWECGLRRHPDTAGLPRSGSSRRRHHGHRITGMGPIAVDLTSGGSPPTVQPCSWQSVGTLAFRGVTIASPWADAGFFRISGDPRSRHVGDVALCALASHWPDPTGESLSARGRRKAVHHRAGEGADQRLKSPDWSARKLLSVKSAACFRWR